MITYKDIQKNKEINAMIEQGNQVLKTLGYTEHSKYRSRRHGLCDPDLKGTGDFK